MFQLTGEEVDILVSQNAIPSKQHLGGYLPYAFTEQGVAAISSVLTSKRAIEVSIHIMRAFVAMRRFIRANAQVFQRLDSLEIRQLQTEKKMEMVLVAIESREVLPRQDLEEDIGIDQVHFNAIPMLYAEGRQRSTAPSSPQVLSPN